MKKISIWLSPIHIEARRTCTENSFKKSSMLSIFYSSGLKVYFFDDCHFFFNVFRLRSVRTSTLTHCITGFGQIRTKYFVGKKEFLCREEDLTNE